MKRSTPSKNPRNEAMKRLTLLKKLRDEAFNALSPRLIASSPSTLYEFMPKLLYNSAMLSNTYVNAKMTMLLNFAKEIVTEYGNRTLITAKN
jgi:hypothetical protein